MSEFVDPVHYIRLETTADNLIGEVSQLISLQDKLMVVDKVFTHAIYLFSNTGKYLYYINYRGMTPKKYVKITSVVIDQQSERLLYMMRVKVKYWYIRWG